MRRDRFTGKEKLLRRGFFCLFFSPPLLGFAGGSPISLRVSAAARGHQRPPHSPFTIHLTGASVPVRETQGRGSGERDGEAEGDLMLCVTLTPCSSFMEKLACVPE